MKTYAVRIFISFLLCLFLGCTKTSFGPFGSASDTGFSNDDAYMASGTIILSRQIPSAQTAKEATAKSQLMAPLVGYFLPSEAYLPADNEAWLEVNSDTTTLSLYEGEQLLEEVPTRGEVTLASGNYYLTSKQEKPIWYAPDHYFTSRELAIPPQGDNLRFRKGALGKMALYLSPDFPIHCGNVWMPEVGGLRVSENALAALFEKLPLGTPIVVK